MPLPGVRAYQELQVVEPRSYDPVISPTSQLVSDTPPAPFPDNIFSVATWNVCGCSAEADRVTIDMVLSRNQILVACLQETRMATCTLRTSAYDWFNVNTLTESAPRMGGGTAIVVRRSQFIGYFFRRISSNICSVRLSVFGDELTIFSIYARSSSSRADPEIADLMNYIAQLPQRQRSNVVILGDMNAHVGYQDLLPVDTHHIGKFLYHPWSNANGESLKDLLHYLNYTLCSSHGPYESVMYTWSRGSSRSQVISMITSVQFFVI